MQQGNQSARVGVFDQLLANQTMRFGFGPIEAPTADLVIAKLTVLAGHGPRARIGLYPDPTSRKWRFDATELASMVHTADIDTKAQCVAELERLTRADALDTPLAIHVGSRFMIVEASHGLGDAAFVMKLMGELGNRRPAAEITPWVTSDTVANPIAAACRHFLAKHPMTALAVVGSRLRAKVRPARTAEAPGKPARTVPASPIAWVPSPSIAAITLSRETITALTDWRNAQEPQRSLAAIQLAVISNAFADVGLPMPAHVNVLCDGRRFLKPGHSTLSYFVNVQPVPLNYPVNSLTIYRGMREATARALPSLVINALKLRKPGVLPITETLETTIVPGTPMNLTYSYLGEMPANGLRWDLRGEEPLGIAAGNTSHPYDVLIGLAHVAGCGVLTINYHDNVFDGKLIQQALNNINSYIADYLVG